MAAIIASVLGLTVLLDVVFFCVVARVERRGAGPGPPAPPTGLDDALRVERRGRDDLCVE